MLDSAKLRAESANSIGVLISYVCRVPCAVFAFVTHMPRFLHTLVSHMLRAVRALALQVPPVFLRLPCLVSHILLCVMCLTRHMLNVLSCFICLLPSVLSCSLCLTYFTCLMSNILSSSSSPLVMSFELSDFYLFDNFSSLTMHKKWSFPLKISSTFVQCGRRTMTMLMKFYLTLLQCFFMRECTLTSLHQSINPHSLGRKYDPVAKCS